MRMDIYIFVCLHLSYQHLSISYGRYNNFFKMSPLSKSHWYQLNDTGYARISCLLTIANLEPNFIACAVLFICDSHSFILIHDCFSNFNYEFNLY